MKPPPPMPHDDAFSTHTAYAVAIAASTALPLRRKISAPISAALGCSAATAPWRSVCTAGEGRAAGGRRGPCPPGGRRTNGDSPSPVRAARASAVYVGVVACAAVSASTTRAAATPTISTSVPAAARLILPPPSARTPPFLSSRPHKRKQAGGNVDRGRSGQHKSRLLCRALRNRRSPRSGAAHGRAARRAARRTVPRPARGAGGDGAARRAPGA